MTNERCSLCGLFGCRHVNPRLPPKLDQSVETLTIGESVGEPMTRVIIPPPPPVFQRREPIVVGAAIVPKSIPNLASANSFNEAEHVVNREIQKIDMKTDWVHCNICKARVFVKYLDMHLKVHTHNFEPSQTQQGQSTAIVKSVPIGPVGTPTTSIIPGTSYTNRPLETRKPTLSRIERYRYRQLDQACCASSVSANGRYSDFTIIFWEKEKPGVVSSVYSGGASYTVKEWERFSIHIVYDSLEEYYTLTSKLMKRGQYSSYDSEDCCPDRICEQTELLSEIKRSLLFFRISPKSAYKHFRRLFNVQMNTEYVDGKAIITQSENSNALVERLKPSTSSGNSHWQGQGWHGHGYDHDS